MDSNLILYLPLSDPDGTTAYDYSANRNDGTLSGGAKFSKKAHAVKAVELNGGDVTTDTVIPFDSDFTLSLYVMPESNQLGWLLNFDGIDNYLEQWLDVVAGEWYLLVFIKSGSTWSVYLNGTRVYIATLESTPIGLSVNSPELAESDASIENVMLYNTAKSVRAINKMLVSPDVEYYIDGVNFKDYGVEVSASSGLIGRLARKDTLTVDWDNYHGIVRDRKRKRYKERTITLECFITASSRSAFIRWVNDFFNLFEGDEPHQLTVMQDGENTSKPLVFMVDLLDEADVEKEWAKNYKDELMVGTFKLKLIEDEPVKRVLRHVSSKNNSTCCVGITSTKLFNIYWGDGTATYNVSSNVDEVTHTYSLPGEYNIVIAGVIEDIEDFYTDAIVVWDTLK